MHKFTLEIDRIHNIQISGLHDKLLVLLLYYLPFDFFLKKYVGNIIPLDISLLKDLVIVGVLLLSLNLNDWKFKNGLWPLLGLIIFIGLNTAYLSINISKIGLSAFRDNLLPFFILYFLTGSDELRSTFNRHLPRILFIVCVGGLVEYFFATEYINTVKGVIESKVNGRLIFTTSSYTIMGFRRMSGFSTGPNDFGILISFLLAIQFISIRENSKFNRLSVILGIICLMFSASRAGIALLLITTAYYYRTQILLKLLKWPVILFIIIFASVFYYAINTELVSDMFTVYSASLTLSDPSSSARFEQVYNSLPLLVTLTGHGLGSSDNRLGNFEGFVESAWFNMMHEIGNIGFLIFVLLLLMLKHTKREYFAYIFSIIFVGFFSINPAGTSYLLFSSIVINILFVVPSKHMSYI